MKKPGSIKKRPLNTDSAQALSNGEIAYNKIRYADIVKRRYALSELKDAPYRPCKAFDTETLHGYAHLIADSNGKYKLDLDLEILLEWLTHRDYRDSHNFFYNIQYDFDAIMKYCTTSELNELVDEGKLDIYGVKISYIQGKTFKLVKNKKAWAYYDLQPFYESSLANASLKYLEGVKNEDNLDIVKIGSNPAYWAAHEADIIKYCIQDCKLTADLADILQIDLIKTLGVNPKSYVSKASMSKSYFRHKCNIPDVRFINPKAKYLAFQAYHGGRFEVTQRGKVGFCTALDINSAYPAEIADLIDITRGEWKNTLDLNKNAHYGFYLATVNIPYMYLPPLAVNWYNTVIFPCGSWTAFFTKEELESLDGIGSYEIHEGCEFWPDKLIYPFKDAINDLYAKKRVTDKKDFKYSLYKIIMNSLYGCFYEKYKDAAGIMHAGMFFNPVYASIICANTRLQLWNMGRKYGKRGVSLATDGILIQGDVKEPTSKALGAWGDDGSGEATILRSGIYSIGEKLRQRGMMKTNAYKTPYGSYANLFDYIKDQPHMKKYPVYNERPVHLKEAIKHHKKYTKEDINIWQEANIAFDLNTDVKRIFTETDITGQELLSMNIQSQPHFIGERY